MPLPQEPVYDALAAHQDHEHRWVFQSTIRELHRWREIINLEFKLELSPTALRIGGARSGCYGHFRAKPNDFGLAREIAFHENHLKAQIANGDFWRTLGTLAHEMLHGWQYDHGKPGRRNYHNVEFRCKAASVGFIVCSRGTQKYVPDSPFLNLLKKHGIVTPEILKADVSQTAGPGSKLKKWTCGCTNVRVAVADFHALCLKCGIEFHKCD